MDPGDLVHIAQEVDKICHSFLYPRKISYFQFKRTYKDGFLLILANHPDFFKDISEKDFVGSSSYTPLHTRQSSIYFWDESLSKLHLSLIQVKQSVYHGLTII